MEQDISDFLANIEHKTRGQDALVLLSIMEEASGYKPYLQGTMIGYGSYHYKYASGHEGNWFVTGFSPRKQNLAIYIMPGFSTFESLLSKLGKHKVGKSCLYINKLADVDLDVLCELISQSVTLMQELYVCQKRAPEI